MIEEKVGEDKVVEAEVVAEPAEDAAKTIDGAASDQAVEPMKVIIGKVIIEVSPNGLNVQAPPNLLLALAILNAGKAFLEMQYTDALRAAIKSQPKILKPGEAGMEAMMNRLRKPS